MSLKRVKTRPRAKNPVPIKPETAPPTTYAVPAVFLQQYVTQQQTAQTIPPIPPPKKQKIVTTTENAVNVVRGYIESSQQALGAVAMPLEIKNVPQNNVQPMATAQQQQQPENKKLQTRRQRKNTLSRYCALTVCIFVVILSLVGMSSISRFTQGNWYMVPPVAEQQPGR